jgi:hypothetical protein
VDHLRGISEKSDVSVLRTIFLIIYISAINKCEPGSSVSIVSGYRGWTTGPSKFDPRHRRKDFSSSLCVQTGSGAHPASCTMDTEGPFPGANARPRRDADHSPAFSAEFENE